MEYEIEPPTWGFLLLNVIVMLATGVLIGYLIWGASIFIIEDTKEDCYRIYFDDEFIVEFDEHHNVVPLFMNLNNLDINNTHILMIKKMDMDFCDRTRGELMVTRSLNER